MYIVQCTSLTYYSKIIIIIFTVWWPKQIKFRVIFKLGRILEIDGRSSSELQYDSSWKDSSFFHLLKWCISWWMLHSLNYKVDHLRHYTFRIVWWILLNNTHTSESSKLELLIVLTIRTIRTFHFELSTIKCSMLIRFDKQKALK